MFRGVGGPTGVSMPNCFAYSAFSHCQPNCIASPPAMRRIGKCRADFFRRVGQLSDENERPLFAVLSYLRPVGGTRCVLLASGHLLLLVSLFGDVDRSMRSRWRLRAST